MSDLGIQDKELTLAINNTNGFSKFTGSFTITAGSVVVGSWQVFHNMTLLGTITGPSGTVQATAAQTGGSQIKFISSTIPGPAGLQIDSITATINCFCAGTLIAAPGGDVAVESLQPGDRILTADGGETAVKWLGRQEVAPRLEHPARVNPICIKAGAIADCVPERDLFVSPDHAIEIDGILINASALVNGSTIYQVAKMPLNGFTYYHIETDAHEVILAENCPAESYLDVPDRSAFINGGERADVPPIQEMDLPRISSARLVPEAIRARLSERGRYTHRAAA